MKKLWSALKYFFAFSLGFIANFSGILDDIAGIPASYKEFKRVYLYAGTALEGSWSNNTEYLLGAGDLNLTGGPVIVMQLAINEHDEVDGEILSEKICETFPLTWIISISSPEPGISGIFSDRIFYIKQLRDNQMQVVAVLALDFFDDRKGIIGLRTKSDPFGILPEKVVLAKNLPAFDEDFEEISKFCTESPQKFLNRTSPSSNPPLEHNHSPLFLRKMAEITAPSLHAELHT